MKTDKLLSDSRRNLFSDVGLDSAGNAADLLCGGHAHPRHLRPVVSHRLDDIRRSVAGHGVFCMDGKAAGLFSKVIGAGIVLVSILSGILLFDRLRLYDLAIDGVLVYFVFFKRIDRHES